MSLPKVVSSTDRDLSRVDECCRWAVPAPAPALGRDAATMLASGSLDWIRAGSSFGVAAGTKHVVAATTVTPADTSNANHNLYRAIWAGGQCGRRRAAR